MTNIPGGRAESDAAVEDAAKVAVGENHKAAVKRLDSSVDRLRAAADLSGLLRVQARAQAVAAGSGGRVRRRAERVVEKASSAAEDLRSGSLEHDEDRADHDQMEPQLAGRAAEATRDSLLARSTSFALLLPREGQTSSSSLEVLRRLTRRSGAGEQDRPAIRAAFDSWAPELIDGYERSRSIFRSLGVGPIANDRQQILRALKSLAVELLTRGGEIRDLQNDAVPLVAYGLLTEAIPAVPDANSPATTEKTNDLLLRKADELSLVPTEARPPLVALFRLAVLLGEADCYGEQLALVQLSLDAPPRR
jgi:hypothetical protein